MRGEYPFFTPVSRAAVGSSPHARGIPLIKRGIAMKIRFIPACAGNTLSSLQKLRPLKVHPRMRGEYFQRHFLRRRGKGSSPHARGIPMQLGGMGTDMRFIPACAGNTGRLFRSQNRNRVHPRMRGEYVSVSFDGASSAGSSPHARGIPVSFLAGVLNRRFIPACAGNTLGRPQYGEGRKVHPRMRGEYPPGRCF